MFAQKLEGLLLGLCLADGTLFDPLGQTTGTMGAGTPFIHLLQQAVGLMNGNHRPLCHDIQLGVGDDAGHLDNAFLLGIQTGHFQVNPDQAVAVTHLAVTYAVLSGG